MNNDLASVPKANILVVDDKPDNLRLLSAMLAQLGYEVRKVIDGKTALKTAQAAPPDLILLDIMMPNMNGYEVCQHLKASPATRDIPVIFISALDEVIDKVKAFAVGGVDYITKPFSEEEVFARVENNLTLRRLQQQLTEQNALLQQEIGNRQKAETALHLSQFYLDQLGDAVFFVNADARFVYVNQAACLHLGYSREQLLSMAVYDIDPNFPVANWESDWQKIRQKDSFTFESTHRTKDGREVIVEVNVNPREFNGQDYNLTVVRDITARKQAEAALLSSEVKFRHLFESAPVGIFSVRLSDGLLLEANQHFLQILGYTCAADAIAQKSMADFLLDPTAQQHILVAKQAAGKVCQYQTQIRKQDGGIISVLLALRIDAAKDCLIGAIALH